MSHLDLDLMAEAARRVQDARGWLTPQDCQLVIDAGHQAGYCLDAPGHDNTGMLASTASDAAPAHREA